MRKKIIIFLIIFGVFFAAGCADNGDSEEPAPSTPVEEVNNGEIAGEEETVTIPEAGQDETGAETEIVDVEIRDYEYIPERLTIEVGQTVRWTNYDTVPHDVVGSGIESEYLQQGEIFTYTFDQEGTYEYICTIHPWMEGEVIAEV